MQSFDELIELVKSEMKKRKLNVIRLSKLTNISQSYLYDLIRGDKRWNQDTIIFVCNALGIKIKFELESKAS